MNTIQKSKINANKLFLRLLHIGFFLIGILTILLGQILPILSARLSLDDRQAGHFFLAQFSGSLIGNFTYSPIIRKLGYNKMLLVGFLLMTLGCTGINFNSVSLSVISVILYGIGIELTIPAINLLVIELNFEKASSSSNIINFFWGLGAILCKPFVDFIGSRSDFFLPTRLLTITLLTVGVAISITNFQAEFKESEGGWITTYESRFTQISSTGLISAALVFFLYPVLGRAIVPLFFRVFSENAVLLFSLLIMTGGIILILWSDFFSGFILGSGIIGIGSSSIFPTNMSRFTNIFGAESTRNAAPLFVFGGLGVAFITWFIGIVSSAFDSLRAGFLVILVCCLFLICLQILLIHFPSKSQLSSEI
jgi:MFS transporter, FHS family, glucose/mannose:H+ symporter